MDKYVQTRNRFVVFLDIMGFKDRVARNSAETLYDELTEFNKDITNIINEVQQIKMDELPKDNSSGNGVIKSETENNGIMLAQFSDSIVLFSQNDSKEDLLVICDVAAKIIKTAIHRNHPIPLKGALAEGIITCDMSKQLFFGQALIDAYLLEENVQYYGIVVHHTAEQSILDSKSDLFHNVKVPLKSGNIEHYEVVWYKDYVDEARKGLERIRLSVSDSPRKYIDNTKMIINTFIANQK